MYVKSVSLKNFRNIGSLNLELSKGINLLYGSNAQGKTNFLESVYFCATGRSHRTNYDRDLIEFEKKEAHVRLYVNKDKYDERIDVHIKKEGNKGIAVNGIAVKKLGELYGVLLTVIFSPEDLQLIKDGPSERRRFMDMEICQLSAVYYYELQQYYKVLKQRNNLLKNIQKNRELRDTLFVWNEQLVNHGSRIIKHREGFISKINILASRIHGNITGGKEKLEIVYRNNVTIGDFMDKLNRYTERDIILGTTSAGIHKDDIYFGINSSDARVFGSQGQQRTASLSLKLAEIELIKEEKGVNPVLLLDDVLSELDKHRQSYLLDSISDIQTIITCTGVEDILNRFDMSKEINIFIVKNGNIALKP